MDNPTAQELVENLAEQYLDRLQAGEQPDRAGLLAAYPDIAARLDRELALREQMYIAARWLDYDRLEPPVPVKMDRSTWGSDDRRSSNRQELLFLAKQPEQIARYVVLEVLGQGASGTIYRAYDPKFDREVALKVLRSDRAGGPEFIERFHREARIAAQLRHPYIVPIHETGDYDGRPYIDMELIDGETLDDHLKRSPLSPREAAELVRQLAEALDYAHRQGIVHRDVKPSNVLLQIAACQLPIEKRSAESVGQFAIPQLADFGLARRSGAEESLTGEGTILGTVAYMSPEQARGGAHEVDGRSDVYSLGVVLYRLLTGRVLFPTEESVTTQLYHIVHTEPTRPRVLNPTLSRDLETICLKALAKDPAERFGTAAAFADELRRWLADEPLHVRPPTVWERTRRWARRNRLAARITVAAALLLVLVGSSLGGMAWVQHKRAYEARVRQILEAETRAEVEIIAVLDRARHRLRIPTRGRRTETQEILKSLAERWRLLPSGKVQDLQREARSLYAATLGVPDLERVEEAKLPQDSWERPWQVALHPDGKALVVGTHLGPIRWVRGQTLKVPGNLDKNQPRPRLAFRPDGKSLAFASVKGGLELWDEEVTRTLAEWKPPGVRPVLDVGFGRDGKTLWVCCDDGRVQLLSSPELKQEMHWQIAGKPSRLTAARFNRDGTRLAVGDEAGRVRLYESNGKWLRELPSTQVPVEALEWSPDSLLVAVGTKDGNIQLWQVSDGIPWHRLTLNSNGVDTIRFTPDGRWVTAGYRNAPLKFWDVKTGESVLTGPNPLWDFSRDGQHFAGGNNTIEFCDLAIPRVLRPLTGHQSPVARLAWCRDNRHLVTLDNRFEVRVWDVARALAMDAFQAPVGGFHAMNAAVAISDDAGTVAYASGGPQGARALQRDVQKHTSLGDWSMPGGFEKLAYAKGKFLLVREEDVEMVKEEDDQPGAKRVLHGLAYEWEMGKPPRKLREVRPSDPADRRRFYESDLTSDGRYYAWCGPRLPNEKGRLEVREVATGRLVTRVPRAAPEWDGGFWAQFSADSRYIGVQAKDGWLLYDLAGTDPPKPLSFGPPFNFSPAFRWWPSRDRDELRDVHRLALRPWGEERVWLYLENSDQSPPNPVSFSPDGRHLAWGSLSGTITVADLPALQKEVAEFEKTFLPR